MLTRRIALTAALAGWASPVVAEQPASAALIYDSYGGLFIDATVNGSGPYRMILDTGASRGVLDLALCRRLALSPRGGGAVEGTAGTIRAQEVEAAVSVVGLTAASVTLSAYSFNSYDQKCVGIIGGETLARAAFQIDYAARQLNWTPSPPRLRAPLTLDNGIPRISARVNDMNLALRIDTGATLSPGDTYFVNLTQAQAAAVGLTGAPRQVFTATGTGGATLELPVYDLQHFSIGGETLAPARAIVQPRAGYFEREDAVGFCGNAVLDKLNPYFDYGNGVFGLSPAPSNGGR